MPQRTLDYPRWYIGLRGFIGGLVIGSMLTSGLIIGVVVPSDRWWHQWILPAIVFGGAGLITGVCEVAFAIQRHRRLHRQMREREFAA